MTERMIVIFRILEGKVIALFPEHIGFTYDVNTCTSYMRIGQHGVASTDLISKLEKATEEQYAPLLEELRGIYTHSLPDFEPTELVVRDRGHASYYHKRLAQMAYFINRVDRVNKRLSKIEQAMKESEGVEHVT